MQIIRGAELLGHDAHVDARGELSAFEELENLPFPLRRVFFLKVDDPLAERGGHANSCDEFIVCISGSVEVELDNGDERCRIRLPASHQGLWIRPGVVIHLRAFRPGTVLLVCASASYRNTRHFRRARPELIPLDGVA